MQGNLLRPAGVAVLLFRVWPAVWPGKWVARHGLGRGGPWRLGARRGQRLVPLHAIPSPGVWWGPGNWSPWELRRCDPLRGIGLMGYVVKCKRGGVVLCHVFKYRKGPAPSGTRCGQRCEAGLPAASGSGPVHPAVGRSAVRSFDYSWRSPL